MYFIPTTAAVNANKALSDYMESQSKEATSSFFSKNIGSVGGAGIDLAQGFINNEFSVDNAEEFGRRRGEGIGSGIGTGLGFLLAPITGGASIGIGRAIGKGLGGLIGERAGERRARPTRMNRLGKSKNFMSFYDDISRQRTSNLTDFEEEGFSFR